MPKPNIQNRLSFKNYLRSNKEKFTSGIQTCLLSDIQGALLNIKSGVDTSQVTNVIIFDDGERVGLSTILNQRQIFYVPALPDDSIIIGVGSDGDPGIKSSIGYKLTFVGDGLGVKYQNKTYGLDSKIGLGTHVSLRILGLGGALFLPEDPPTYSITPSITTVIEGSTVSFAVTTTNVGIGTTLYYSLVGSASSSDFLDNTLTGSFTINSISNGVGIGSFSKTVIWDQEIEPFEGFVVDIFTGSLDPLEGTLVSTSVPVYIQDKEPPKYSVGVSTTIVNESESIIFTIDTIDVGAGTTLYYTTDGAVTASDFSNDSLTGSFTIVSTGATTGIATITRTIAKDIKIEGDETFNLAIRTGSTSGTIVATSSTITVSNLPFTVNVGVSTLIVSEGQSVDFIINTIDVPAGSTFYYSTDGTVSAADFSNNSLTGSFTIVSTGVITGIATITRTISKDLLVEGDETFNLVIREGSTSGTIVGTSSTVTVSNLPFVVNVGVSTDIVNEGQSVTFTVNTTNVSTGTTFYYSTSGDVSDSDFTNNSLVGSFNIVGTGATTGIATITRTLAGDISSDYGEKFNLEIRTDSTSGTIVATSSTITVLQNYFVGVSTTIVTEGQSVSFTVNTLNLPSGTTRYYSTSGAVSAADFTNNSLTGSFTIVGTGSTTGVATITRTLATDLRIEGDETFNLVIREGSTTGTIVATSSTITVTDIPPIINVGVSTTVVTEGDTIDFIITGTNIPSVAGFYYNISGITGTVDTGDLFNNLSGSFNIVNGTAVISKSVLKDLVLEGDETFNLTVRNDSITGPIVATSPTVTIKNLPFSIDVGVSTTVVTEGESVSFTVNTIDVPPGQFLYYSIGGTVVAADFTNNSLVGSFNIVGTGATTGISTITRTISKDLITEGDETFNLSVRYGSTSGTILATSPTVTIKNLPFSVDVVGVSTTVVTEGESVSFTVNTIDITPGTTLYYSTSGAVSAADFTNNSLTGSFTIVGTGSTTGVATITRTISNDTLIEGSETFSLSIRINSTAGTIVATSPTITVSNLPFTVDVGVSTTIVSEPPLPVGIGSTVLFTLTTTGIPNGATVRGRIVGVTGTIGFTQNSTYADIDAQDKIITINNNSGTVMYTILREGRTEGVEQFRLDILNSTLTGVIASSPTISILDNSYLGVRSTGLTYGPIVVSRDAGNPAYASDWYTLCKLDDLPDGSKIALFIDNSGSMTTGTVQASYDLLMSKLQQRNMSVIVVTNGNEDWITPFTGILD